MASVLDIGILEYFTPVFVFLFVFAIVFAILEKTGILGKNKGMNSLVAFAMAVLFVLTPEMINLVYIALPWFAVLLISMVLLVLIFLFLGIKSDLISETASRSGVAIFIIVVCFLIFLYALSEVYGPQVHSIYGDEQGAKSEESFVRNQIGEIVFHPRSLGVAFILLVMAFAVRFIGKSYT